MSHEQWTFTSSYVVMPRENVDTDQIIPARFLTTTDRAGLGPHAFSDWRYRADGLPDPDFVLNQDAARGAQVLVAGRNFGCGSSREHAVWALAGAGFRAVVSTEFADIFRGNALGNGLLPIVVSPISLAKLMGDQALSARVTVNLETRTFTLPDGDAVPFVMPPFSRYCLLHDTNEMSFLLDADGDISAYESMHPVTIDTMVLETTA